MKIHVQKKNVQFENRLMIFIIKYQNATILYCNMYFINYKKKNPQIKNNRKSVLSHFTASLQVVKQNHY